MASTVVDNRVLRRSRRLLPRISKKRVTSLIKGLRSPYDLLNELVSDLPGNVEALSIQPEQRNHSPSSLCRGTASDLDERE